MEAITTAALLELAAVAVGAGIGGGILAGLLGVGGGIVIVPALYFALNLTGMDPGLTMKVAVGTSLPELATSVAAVRMNAPELAISNVLGSNLFNMGVVLLIDDAAYADGVLWAGISQVHMLTGAIAVLMTTVVIVALLRRPRRRPFRSWTFEGAGLMALYVAATLLVFRLA